MGWDRLGQHGTGFLPLRRLALWPNGGHLGGCPGCKVLRGKVLAGFGTGWDRLLYCNPPRSSGFGAEINRKCIIERTLRQKGYL